MRKRVSKVWRPEREFSRLYAWLGFMIAALFFALLLGARGQDFVVNQISATSDVRYVGQSIGTWNIYQADSVTLDLWTRWDQAVFPLTNDNLFVVLYVSAATNRSLVYISSTGTIVSAALGHSRFYLPGSNTVIQPQDYQAWAHAFQRIGTTNKDRGNLAKLNFKWLYSPAGDTYSEAPGVDLSKLLSSNMVEAGAGMIVESASNSASGIRIRSTVVGGEATNASLVDAVAGGIHLANSTNITWRREGTNFYPDVNGAVGPQGPTGPPGTNGLNGTNGMNGATGAQGPPGTNGLNGTNGMNGATGPTGPPGTNGLNGTNGTNGMNGADGPAGPAGTNFVSVFSNGNFVGASTGLNFCGVSLGSISNGAGGMKVEVLGGPGAETGTLQNAAARGAILTQPMTGTQFTAASYATTGGVVTTYGIFGTNGFCRSDFYNGTNYLIRFSPP